MFEDLYEILMYIAHGHMYVIFSCYLWIMFAKKQCQKESLLDILSWHVMKYVYCTVSFGLHMATQHANHRNSVEDSWHCFGFLKICCTNFVDHEI